MTQLQPMGDVPVPRPHAGKKSKRLTARPWEAKLDTGQPAPILPTRRQRRALQRHLAKHHHAS
jgi:hypothetical protein